MRKRRYLYIILASTCILTACGKANTPISDSTQATNTEATSQATTEATKDSNRDKNGYFITAPNITPVDRPSETYKNDYEKQAAAIIDDAIYAALADVNVMRRNDLSHKSFDYDKYANDSYNKLTDKQKNMIDNALKAGTSFESITIKESEYGKSLITDALTISTPLTYIDPKLSAYYCLDVLARDVTELYFDPAKDANTVIKVGSPEFDGLKEQVKVLDAVISRIIEKMPTNLSTYDQYYYLAAVISHQAHYTTTNEGNVKNKYSPYAALITHSSVCQGYALAFQILCEKANLWCVVKNGTSRNIGHAWNMIKLEDGTYNIDITWADDSGSPESKQWYAYFIRSEEAFELNGHTLTEGEKATGKGIVSPYGN